jgi:hypothetical protein
MSLLLEHRRDGKLTTGKFSRGYVLIEVEGALTTFSVEQARLLCKLSNGLSPESRDWTLRIVPNAS